MVPIFLSTPLISCAQRIMIASKMSRLIFVPKRLSSQQLNVNGTFTSIRMLSKQSKKEGKEMQGVNFTNEPRSDAEVDELLEGMKNTENIESSQSKNILERSSSIIDDKSNENQVPEGAGFEEFKRVAAYYSKSELEKKLAHLSKLPAEYEIKPEDYNWMDKKNVDRLKRYNTRGKGLEEHLRGDESVLDLALKPSILRHFVTSTGHLLPRRFTGLKAKEHNKVSRAVRVSRQLALFPYTSKYPVVEETLGSNVYKKWNAEEDWEDGIFSDDE